MPAEPEQLPPKVTNAPPYDVFHNPLMCPITARDLEFRSPTGITLPPRNVLLTDIYYFTFILLLLNLLDYIIIIFMRLRDSRDGVFIKPV